MSPSNDRGHPALPPADTLIPWVLRRNAFALLSRIWAARGEEALPLFDIADEFACGAAFATDDGPVPARPAVLTQMGLDTSQALQAAIRNMSPCIENMRIVDDAFIQFESENGSAPGLMLGLVEAAVRANVDGAPIVIAPTRNTLLICGEDDERGLASMLDMAESLFDASQEFLSLRALRMTGDATFECWQPPEGHPLRTRAMAMFARAWLRQIDVSLALQRVDPAEPRAHLSVGEDGRIVAGWSRGTSVIVPLNTARVVLLDTPGDEPAHVELPLAVLLNTLPWAAEDVGEGELFVRLPAAAFPTPRTRRFLTLRARHDRVRPDRGHHEVARTGMLAELEAGAPHLVDVARDGRVKVESPDGRAAFFESEAIEEHIAALPPADRAVLIRTVVSIGSQARERAGQDPTPNAELVAALAGLERLAEKQCTRLLGSDLVEPTTLYPVLRPRGYLETSRESLRGMRDTRLSATTASLPFHAGITIDIVSGAGNAMRPLVAPEFPEELFAAARDTALLNLRAASLAPLRPLAEGAWEGPWRDGYGASRVLIPSIFEGCRVKGDRLLFAPTILRLWLAGSADPAAIDAVLDAIEKYLASDETVTPFQWREMLVGVPFVLTGGAMMPWTVPDGHPCAGRIRNLDGVITARREQAARAARAQMRGGDA